MKKAHQGTTERYQFILWVCGIIFLVWSALQLFLLFWYNLPFPEGFTDSVVSGFISSISCFIVANALHFYQPGKERYSYILVWVLSLAALATYLSQLSISWLIANDAYINFVQLSLPLRFLAGFLLIGCTAIINVLWNSQKSQSEQEKRKNDAEKLAKEAELYNLRQQLQPHFLFNSLNSIIALIGNEPEQAKEMVFQLSDFLRGTLRKDDQQLIPFVEEIEHLKLYLEIEKVRFGHRLEVQIDVPEDTKQKKLPAMIVQPLLENAIKYGLYDTTEKVSIHIDAQVNPSSLDIQISNPYDPENSIRKKSSGFGLRSVERRLFLLYGRTDLLKTKNENETFIAQLKIPQYHD
jgi:sensor histidine kinase YesM